MIIFLHNRIGIIFKAGLAVIVFKTILSKLRTIRNLTFYWFEQVNLQRLLHARFANLFTTIVYLNGSWNCSQVKSVSTRCCERSTVESAWCSWLPKINRHTYALNCQKQESLARSTLGLVVRQIFTRWIFKGYLTEQHSNFDSS